MNHAAKLYFLLPALFTVSSLAQAQNSTLNIPQIVDGGPWQTTLVVTNTGTTPASAGLAFFQETGNQQTGNGTTIPWSLIVAERNTVQLQAFNLPVGTTLILHTLGTAITTTIGWGQLTQTAGDPGAVAVYAIFTQRVGQAQSGTAPGVAAATRVLIPFDNTNGSVTAVAVVNPSINNENITVGVRTPVASSQPTGFSLSPQGHMSFNLQDLFPGTTQQTGIAEFLTSSGISVVALRFNGGAFTTSPVYPVTGAAILAPPVP
jgi:hypothetical protein